MRFALRTPAMLMAGLSILAVGCASAPRSELRAAYDAQTITIDRTVAMPGEIHYVSVGQRWAGVAAGIAGGLGAVAGAALVGGISSTAAQTAAISASSAGKVRGGADESVPRYFASNAIDVGQIFALEMRQTLERNQFAVGDGGRANHLRLSVIDYGFHSTEMFGREMRLVMKVKAELFSPGGHRIWAKDSSVGSNHVGLPERSFEEYLSDPAGLAEGFRRICGDMAERLQRDLRQQHAQLAGRRSNYVAQSNVAAPIAVAAHVAPAVAPVVMDDAPPAPVAAQAHAAEPMTSPNSGGSRYRFRTLSPSPATAASPSATDAR
jgi:hypothetical protein